MTEKTRTETEADSSFAYEDILYEKPPKSTRHSPMSLAERAAQFAPFAAMPIAKVRETAENGNSDE